MDLTLADPHEGPISTWLAVAALLIVLLALAHSILGERFILRRLFRRENLPKLFGSDDFTKRTLRFAWHLTTVVWWGVALLLFTLGTGSIRGSFLVLSGTAFVSALVALIGSRGRHPAWLVLLIVGTCIWIGSATT